MSKINEVEEIEEEVYEDWQYETSGQMASEFIEKQIMPVTDKIIPMISR